MRSLLASFVLLALVGAACLCTASPSLAQSVSPADVLGLWKTIDDETGRPRSIVRIYQQDGEVRGTIERLIREPDENPDPLCEKCDGDRKNIRITGMDLLWGLTANGGVYEGGHIIDPGKGKIYRAKIWVEHDELQVRGYWGPFHRTQTWLRATESDLR